jgi:hypothetical protein
MIFREDTIPKTPGRLRDVLGVAILNVPRREFPKSPIDGKPYWDFDGIFHSMKCGVENLRKKFGNVKADQILDMLAHAKAHYEAGENRLGGPLLQDVQMVVMGRQPWAYPRELYRWGIDSSLPELSEADLLSKDDEEP